MGRVEHYSQFDDPYNYFRRLESYAPTPPRSYAGSRQNSPRFSGSPTGSPRAHQYSPTRPKPCVESRRSSPRYSGSPATIPRAYHESQTGSDATSKPESSSKLRRTSYGDSESATYDEKSPPSSPRRKYLNQRERTKKAPWSRKRKLIVLISVVSIIPLVIITGVAVYLAKSAFSYTPSFAQVTNQKAFEYGGATHNNPNDTSDGVGKGQDTYKYYSGGSENFPSSYKWVSFGDMWEANLLAIQNSCTALNKGMDNSQQDTQDIYNSIQNRANASLVDHRFILAVILQESHGCVYIGTTQSSNGVRNPGLMQSHNGHSFSSYHPTLSILAMVQDGTQGTKDGAGLVQNLNTYGNAYSAARGYNSGYIPKDGDLSAAAGATACYVSDIANRLTGWVNAKSTCPGDDD